MQRLEVSGAVRLIYRSLGVKGLREHIWETTALHYVTFVAESYRPCLIKDAEE